MGSGWDFCRGLCCLKLDLVYGGQHDEPLLQDRIGGAAVAVIAGGVCGTSAGPGLTGRIGSRVSQ